MLHSPAKSNLQAIRETRTATDHQIHKQSTWAHDPRYRRESLDPTSRCQIVFNSAYHTSCSGIPLYGKQTLGGFQVPRLPAYLETMNPLGKEQLPIHQSSQQVHLYSTPDLRIPNQQISYQSVGVDASSAIQD